MTLELDSDPAPGARLSVGDLEIEMARPISRCAVIDLDPATGEWTNTLLLQRIPAVRGEIPFGMCARVVRPGIVRRGTPSACCERCGADLKRRVLVG